MVSVVVNSQNIEGSLRAIKKKMQREGIFREMKIRRNFETNSEKKKRKLEESVRRFRKMRRKTDSE